MGRWAQSRHRGRGNAAAPVSLFVPPTNEDWSLSDNGEGNAAVNTDGGACALAGVGYDVRYDIGVDPSGPSFTDGQTCGSPVTLPASPGDTVHAQIRWRDALDNVTDWSPVQTFTTS